MPLSVVGGVEAMADQLRAGDELNGEVYDGESDIGGGEAAMAREGPASGLER